MKPIRWLAGAALFALLAWALIFAYRKGKEERQKEVQREEPVIAPIRVAADSHGVVVRIDPAEVERSASSLEPARPVSTAPTEAAEWRDRSRFRAYRLPARTGGGSSRGDGGHAVARARDLVWLPAPSSRRSSDARPLSFRRRSGDTVGARPGEIVQSGQVLLAISDSPSPWRACVDRGPRPPIRRRGRRAALIDSVAPRRHSL